MLRPRRPETSPRPKFVRAGSGHSLEGLVNAHALTRTVRDSAALLDVIAGSAPGDPYTAPPPTARYSNAIAEEPAAQRILLATASPFPGSPTDPAVAAAVENTGQLLGDIGHIVEPGSPTIDPDVVADAIAVLHTVSKSHFRVATSHLGREPVEDEFEPSTWVMVREGFTTTGAEYARAIEAVHAQTRRFAAGMAGYDVLLVPTLLTPPPLYALLDQPRGTTRAYFDVEFATTGWTSLANVTGWAAISLPPAPAGAGGGALWGGGGKKKKKKKKKK